MKKYSILLIIVCIGLFARSNDKGDDIVLYDGSRSLETISSPYDTKYEKRGDILWMEKTENKHYSGISIKGNWDLSTCNKITVELVTTNCKSFPVYIMMESPGITEKSKNGIFVEKVNTTADSEQELMVKIPASLPYPEVEDKLFKMRVSPLQTETCYYLSYQYGLKGNIPRLKPNEVSEIKIYVSDSGLNSSWGIKRVVANAGEPEELPEWANLPEEKFFPFIDKYGQFIHKDWPGKVQSDQELQLAVQREIRDLKANPGAPELDKYGGWEGGPKQEATGSFYVKKIDGKWWFVDPEGNLFWSHGVVRVTPSSAVTPLNNRGFYFQELPSKDSPFAEFYTTCDELLRPYYGSAKTYDFSASNIFRKYGSNWRNEFAEMAHRRLKSWGMNTLANSSDRSICLMSKTPYADRIEMYSPNLEGSDKSWKKFKDPFHPEFREYLKEQLNKRKEELDDPYCIGFFVDNEYHWGNKTSLAEWTLLSPASQPAKIEFVKNLRLKYDKIKNLNKVWGSEYKNWNDLLQKKELPLVGSEEDCTEFSSLVIDAYFRNIKEVFSLVAPKKLYLGCRFAGSNKVVLEIAAKYCDVMSYNIYRYSLSDWSLLKGIDLPVIVGEFHFGALDRGLFHYSLKKTENQQERAEAYKTYVESALNHPNIIGTHWHQFADQPATGRFDGENFQVGLTDICDNPYPEAIEKVREVGYKMYHIRSGK